MYIPELYKNENRTEIRNFTHENAFALLINNVNRKPWATHIPLLLECKKLHNHHFRTRKKKRPSIGFSSGRDEKMSEIKPLKIRNSDLIFVLLHSL